MNKFKFDKIQIVGILFLVITLITGTAIARNRGFSLNPNSKAVIVGDGAGGSNTSTNAYNTDGSIRTSNNSGTTDLPVLPAGTKAYTDTNCGGNCANIGKTCTKYGKSTFYYCAVPGSAPVVVPDAPPAPPGTVVPPAAAPVPVTQQRTTTSVSPTYYYGPSQIYTPTFIPTASNQRNPSIEPTDTESGYDFQTAKNDYAAPNTAGYDFKNGEISGYYSVIDPKTGNKNYYAIGGTGNNPLNYTQERLQNESDVNNEFNKSNCLQEGGYWDDNLCSYSEQNTAKVIIQEDIKQAILDRQEAERIQNTSGSLSETNRLNKIVSQAGAAQNQQTQQKGLSILDKFNNAISNSSLDGLGSTGLGGGNATLIPPSTRVVDTVNNNGGIYDYAVKNATLFGAGFTTAVLVTPGAPAFVFETVTSIPGVIRSLTLADVADNVITGVGCAMGNSDACAGLQASILIPAPTGVGNMLTDSIDDFSKTWSPGTSIGLFDFNPIRGLTGDLGALPKSTSDFVDSPGIFDELYMLTKTQTNHTIFNSQSSELDSNTLVGTNSTTQNVANDLATAMDSSHPVNENAIDAAPFQNTSNDLAVTLNQLSNSPHIDIDVPTYEAPPRRTFLKWADDTIIQPIRDRIVDIPPNLNRLADTEVVPAPKVENLPVVRPVEIQNAIDQSFNDLSTTSTIQHVPGYVTEGDTTNYMFGNTSALEVVGAKLKESTTTIKVLDIGAARGGFINNAKNTYPSIEAYGLSAHDYRSTGNPLTDIDYRIGNAENIAQIYPPNTFDIITSNVTVTHFIDPLGALLQMYDSLKPNGILLIDEFRIPGIESSMDDLSAFLKNNGYDVIIDLNKSTNGSLSALDTNSVNFLIIRKGPERLNLPIEYAGIASNGDTIYKLTGDLQHNTVGYPKEVNDLFALERSKFSGDPLAHFDDFMKNNDYSDYTFKQRENNRLELQSNQVQNAIRSGATGAEIIELKNVHSKINEAIYAYQKFKANELAQFTKDVNSFISPSQSSSLTDLRDNIKALWTERIKDPISNGLLGSNTYFKTGAGFNTPTMIIGGVVAGYILEKTNIDEFVADLLTLDSNVDSPLSKLGKYIAERIKKAPESLVQPPIPADRNDPAESDAAIPDKTKSELEKRLENFNNFMQINNTSVKQVINPWGATLLELGCNQSTAINTLELLGIPYDPQTVIDDFLWDPIKHQTGADAVLVTLQQSDDSLKGAAAYGTKNRILDATELNDYSGILIWGGYASGYELGDTSKNKITDLGHTVAFVCDNGDCYSIDSYLSSGKPEKCTIPDASSIKCGSAEYFVGEIENKFPSVLYPVMNP